MIGSPLPSLDPDIWKKTLDCLAARLGGRSLRLLGACFVDAPEFRASEILSDPRNGTELEIRNMADNRLQRCQSLTDLSCFVYRPLSTNKEYRGVVMQGLSMASKRSSEGIQRENGNCYSIAREFEIVLTAAQGFLSCLEIQ